MDDAADAAAPKPSSSDCWNAWSRFGPTVPFVPARASMWQEPHFCDEQLLARDEVGARWPLDRRRRPAAAPWPQRRTIASERRTAA